MPKRLSLAGCAGLLLLASAGSVFAGANPPTIGGKPIQAQLVFTTPTGLAAPTDLIQVFETLSLSGTSVGIQTDATGQVVGLTDADITPWLNGTPGVNLATDQLQEVLNSGIGCGGSNFTTTCVGGGPYDFSFNHIAPVLSFADNFNLAPGNSLTFLFGTFAPTGGSAPPGTYVLPRSNAVISVFDLSLAGHPVIANLQIADTTGEPAFTRTVAGTPEPGSWSMLLGGFASVGFMLRRKRRK
jgi:PEP-CTERM motif